MYMKIRRMKERRIEEIGDGERKKEGGIECIRKGVKRVKRKWG